MKKLLGKRKALSILLGLLGLCVLLYPWISDGVSKLNGSYAIQRLSGNMGREDPRELVRQREMAVAYNMDPQAGMETYEKILDFGNGIMGYLEIPRIQVKLPLYHGVSEQVLAKGVGHLPGSALPIGGDGNHTVLSGHTGLPEARLFTDLDKLEIGDMFSIHILKEILYYRVDQILVVLPDDGENLKPEAGKDLCTLVTCTPYGINSHRLLVRGCRVVDQGSETEGSREEREDARVWPYGILLTFCGIWILAIRRKRREKYE